MAILQLPSGCQGPFPFVDMLTYRKSRCKDEKETTKTRKGRSIVQLEEPKTTIGKNSTAREKELVSDDGVFVHNLMKHDGNVAL